MRMDSTKMVRAPNTQAQRRSSARLLQGFVGPATLPVPGRIGWFTGILRSQLPRAEVELRELAPGEQIDALYHDKLDLGLFHAQLEDAALETAVVSRERLIVALPSAALLAEEKQNGEARHRKVNV